MTQNDYQKVIHDTRLVREWFVIANIAKSELKLMTQPQPIYFQRYFYLDPASIHKRNDTIV